MQTKLKMNLEDLAVDTFDTTRNGTSRGTVFGEQCTCYTKCECEGDTDVFCGPSEIPCDSYQYSCAGTCGCVTWQTECDCAPTCVATACNEGPCC